MKTEMLGEMLLGGTGACLAGFFTNPLEVVKTRMQLQGELKARGQYTRHYKNVFHAFYTIIRYDGFCAIQKGLVPALWYQFMMNGFRLGSYQTMQNIGWTSNKDGSINFVKSSIAGGVSGVIGAVVGSPIYMVKTQLQARAAQEIAVGHQHTHTSMTRALLIIYKENGLKGLWRGVSGAVARVSVGSATQLATFSKSNQLIEQQKFFKQGSTWNTLLASMVSGVAVVAMMTPFDVVSTRLYNQGVDKHGKGEFYKGFFDCFTKIFKTEGLWGFYKGWAASLFRLGPHTVLSLVFWQSTRKAYENLFGEKLNN